MTVFRQLVALVAVAWLIPVGFPQQAQAMAAAERGEGFRQKVEQLGAGAEVRVMLRGQEQALHGTVESFNEATFILRSGKTVDQRLVRYDDVSSLAFTQRTYRAEGSPDLVTVRRVAVELGVGRNIQLQTQDGKKVVGRIAKLEQEQLNLDVGGSGPMNVPYAQIHELKPGEKSTLAKVGIIVGVSAASFLVLAIVLYAAVYR